MLATFFIDRPIFAWVIAIIVMLGGLLAIETLPVSQYPDVAPPTVSIRASYPGASAQAVENSVTQVIEQELTGIDNLLYFSSTSSASGDASITVTFDQGTDPDIAQVQVQNKVRQAESRLPQEVQSQGVTVTKSQSDFLLIVGLYDETGESTSNDVADYLVSNLQDVLSRVNGVGGATVFGSEYAMRIWLDPHKLNSFALMPSDVESAIEAQNTQVTAGELGALPSVAGQQLNATVTALSRLQRPEQFEDIILKTQTDGGVVRVKDVARVEVGAEDYSMTTRLNGHPAAGMAIQLASGANALSTATAVKDKVEQLSAAFPAGYKVAYPRDSTTFVSIAIEEVVKTLFEAIGLVVVVMFVFLQNWRATLIPAIAVPVVLLGTFGVLAVFGYTINTLTLFAMVLAIGLLVDDAIVVVENVERVMQEEKLSPRAATAKSMGEITGALVGIALVLSAVFLPMAFFGGSTGVIYRQFSVTIVAAMALSVVVALVLTPALCATLLKPPAQEHRPGAFFRWFNRGFDRTRDRYGAGIGGILKRPRRFLLVYAGVSAAMVLLYLNLPSGFLPEEDQGQVMLQYTLPTGASMARTLEVAKAVERYFIENEAANNQALFTVSGRNFNGESQNTGLGFMALTDWDDRPGEANSAQAITGRAFAALSRIRDALVFTLVPPAISGLGQSSGFDFWLQDASGAGHERLVEARDSLIAAAADDPTLAGVRVNGLEDTAQLHVEIDQAKAGALGLSQSDINATLDTAWGGTYVNDFIDRGRIKKVYLQGDAPYRALPEDLGGWFVRGSSGAMAPLSAFTKTSWTFGPQLLQRFNGLPAVAIQGSAASGSSSGEAMAAIAALAGELPDGFSYAWSGLAFQEQLSSSQAPLLYAVSILVIFLCLAALYESWSIPVSVLLVIPLGAIGAVLAVTLRGLFNDVYFQVGLLTTIGLTAKNAILIVEFAEAGEKQGRRAVAAAIEAACLRLRPILMTSIAFVVGVLPLALASGAGAASQNDIGTGIVGGVLTGTLLTIFYVPLFFVLVRRIFHGKAPAPRPAVGGREQDA